MYKLLVPIDGSEVAERAMQTAVSLCQKREGETHITLLHVASVEYYPGMAVASVNINLDETVSKEGEELLQESLNKIKNAGIHVDSVLLKGYAAKEICEYANENGYDMIVIGNRGRGAFGELILGSVSHKVLHHAKCPVLIVK
ncbi:universal stress protein [Fictibacillus sp. Mic-4]|uniref:universal stress protein n=1 Tax=Fictibacillus sp. Mic-4 TaxID=3132826 RepID=UPI003CED583B